MDTLISSYSNKEVPFHFAGTDLSFFLSQALFSSYEIDRGSRLLLKTLGKRVDFDRISTVLDIGCGVGTLGISLQKGFPHIKVTMQDRDALAVAFSRYNARYNAADGADAVGGLAFQGLEQQVFDLIVSNIPAKAGEPVLRDMFGTMLQRSAMAAVVVVRPLADYTAGTLQALGAEVSFREEGPGHTVFHFASAESPSPASRDSASSSASSSFSNSFSAPAEDLPSAYFRTTGHFECGHTTYSLDTVWGLADFDTVPFQTRVVEKSIRAADRLRRVCIWNPGQGHTSSMLAASLPSQLYIDLMGRDMLALQTSRHNLLGRQQVRLGKLRHSPGPRAAASQLKKDAAEAHPDLFIVELEHLAGVPSSQEVLAAGELLLDTGGTLLITGKSAHLAQFERSPAGFRPIASKKHKGYKSVVLNRL
ncbi:MAG: methyltransferase [Spirochaetota bacterium]